MKFKTIAFCLGLVFWGCDKAEKIPAYVRIEPFTVNALGGAGWQQITEAWLYVNNEIIGGFHLPAEVPLLLEGDAVVQIFPGVKVNGLQDSPGLYPFLKRHVETIALSPGNTTVVRPVTSYEDGTRFAWPIEESTFDDASSVIFESRDTDPGSSFSVTTDGGFAGKCLMMPVDTAHAIIEVASESVSLPNTGDRQVWLELHYRGDIPFSFSILGADPGQFEEIVSVYLFNATDDNGWNKIYLNLTEYLVALPRPSYRLFFRVPLPRNEKGEYTKLDGVVRLDNIRLLHF